MKTIAIVATGGTIAGTGKKGKTAAYHAGEIDIDSIIETIPEINEVAHIKEYQLMNIDSNEMTHEKWLILKNNIEEILSDDTIDGAVVTHGTDTLDETAYFLTLTLNTPKPVVLTGARVVGTGRSDYPNQINNVLAFPGIFKGALEARVPSITPEMKVAVAKAIADTISDEDLNEENIMPKIFNKDVTAAVANAIKQFAK